MQYALENKQTIATEYKQLKPASIDQKPKVPLALRDQFLKNQTILFIQSQQLLPRSRLHNLQIYISHGFTLKNVRLPSCVVEHLLPQTYHDNVCFYIVQYPVHWTAQSTLHLLTSLTDLFIPTPTRLLRKAF